jgi:hypothetical protein
MNRACSCAKPLGSPAVPVVVVAVVVVTVMMVVVPAMPTMMIVVMVAVVSPMHFRCRQPGVILNRRGGAGTAER